MKEKITIFTDGAAKGNPGRGGFGAVIDYGDIVLEIGAYKIKTTALSGEVGTDVLFLPLRELYKSFHSPVLNYRDFTITFIH